MVRASPFTPMKLQELKRRTRQVWEALNTWKGGGVLQPENFDKEVKDIGDRRYKKTWIKALARFKAAQLHRSCLDAWTLITISFNYHPDRWDYEYRYEIVDEFLLYPEGMELIKAGLEQIFTTDGFTHKEREDTHGFLKLLEGREAQHRGLSIPVGPQRAIAGTHAAA